MSRLVKFIRRASASAGARFPGKRIGIAFPSGIDHASSLDAALQGRECRITRREADWSFDFGERLNIAVSVPWGVVTADGIAHGDEDDGQRFGLAKQYYAVLNPVEATDDVEGPLWKLLSAYEQRLAG